MIPITHELDISEDYADAIIRGTLTTELRMDNRRYAIGDIIKYVYVSNGRPVLDNPILNKRYKITYLFRSWGLKDNWVAFSIKEITDEEESPQVVTREVRYESSN